METGTDLGSPGRLEFPDLGLIFFCFLFSPSYGVFLQLVLYCVSGLYILKAW